MKNTFKSIATSVGMAATLLGCNGDGTLLDLYPMDPIVNPETRTLIRENRIVHAQLGSRNRISGITEGGGFSTADKFRSFQFEPYAFPVGQGAMGFGNGLIVHAIPDGSSFVLRYSEDNGKTWDTYGQSILDDENTMQGTVNVLKLLVVPDGSVWLLCQHHIGTARKVLLYKVDLGAEKSSLLAMEDNATALDIGVADQQRAWLLCSMQHGTADNVHLLKTANGGSAWSTVCVLEDTHDPRLEIVDVGTLLIHNQSGQVLHSADGGSSFAPVSIPGGGIAACEAVSLDVVYALLINGKLGKSSDGGKTWSALGTNTHGIDISGTTLHFYSEQQGIVYGDDRMFLTEDGGHSWDVLVYPYPYMFD
ncbi:hypothetical protein ACFOET_16690 [Parapedobacter deserti]|uniref:Exo-alpha-sialidase n=1 Tax=Parapedobacter deserti TaxID=1912957 RepID=A0ABV7JMF2_9SPHI